MAPGSCLESGCVFLRGYFVWGREKDCRQICSAAGGTNVGGDRKVDERGIEQNSFGLFCPFGLRAGALVSDCDAISRPLLTGSHPSPCLEPGTFLQLLPRLMAGTFNMAEREGFEPSIGD